MAFKYYLIFIAHFLANLGIVFTANVSGRHFVFAYHCINEAQLFIQAVPEQDTACSIAFEQDGMSQELKQVSNRNTSLTYRICNKLNPDFKSRSITTAEITCNRNVMAFLRTDYDTYPLISTDNLGLHYLIAVQSKGSSQQSSTFIIATALYDGTSVEVSHTKNQQLSLNNVPKDGIILRKKESFVLTSIGSLMGVKVSANKPITVTSGVRYMEDGERVVRVAAMPPLSSWGKEYFLFGGMSYVISGFGKAVNCSIGTESLTFHEHSLYIEEPTVLNCTTAVIVIPSDIGRRLASTLVPSVTSYDNLYQLAVSETAGVSHYKLNVVTRQKDFTDELEINGVAATKLSRNITHVKNSSFVMLEYNVDNKITMIRHKNPTCTFYADVVDSEGVTVSYPWLRAVTTGQDCRTSIPSINDKLDNDCDFLIDEELPNGIDDDGDLLIDEDTAANEFYHHSKPDSRAWHLSYTVLIVLLIILAGIIAVALLHKKYAGKGCSGGSSRPERDILTISSTSGMSSTVSRYSLSASYQGMTFSKL